MFSTLVWCLALAIGVAACVGSAAVDSPGLHMGLTAAVCIGYAVFAVLDQRALAASGAGPTALASSGARSMALVWAWAAISLFLTYALVLDWGEWWQYVLGAGAIAALCLLFARTLARDARAGRQDDAMLKIARYLALGQLVGMVVAMVGLVLDSKMPRSPDKPDWAASAIFFFGAAALAAISANGLRTSPRT
jgi:hypothetical protein